MRRSLLLVVLAMAGCARPVYRAPNADTVLTVDGRVRGAPIAFDAASLAKLEQRTVRGKDPLTGQVAEYRGTSLLALVHELDPRPEADLAVVHGARGYAVAVPLPAVRQHQPVLADQADGKPVADVVPGAGRFALAWPNVDAPGFDLDPRVRWWWARDITSIDLVPWFETYGRALRVPPGASDAARRGADQFATSCIQCHRLRDAGGKVGPDLSSGLSTQDRARFVAAVRSHPERVPETKGADLTSRLSEIVAFLEVVQAAGPLPAEETPPELKRREENPPSMRPPGGY